jgi:hypothetical protein
MLKRLVQVVMSMQQQKSHLLLLLPMHPLVLP